MSLAPSDSTSGFPLVPTLSAPEQVPVYGKKILISSPWHKSACPLTAFCVAQLVDRRRTATLMNFGDAFVAHSRNRLADEFLKSSCEWLLTIDDDMIVPFGNARWFQAYTGFNFPEKFLAWNAIDRLISHGKTLVGALYFGKHDKSPAMYNESSNPQELAYAKLAPYDLIKPTRWVATGCMLIHRQVFEDIEKRFPALARDGGGKGGNWFTSTEASLIQRVTLARDFLTRGPMTAEKGMKVLELLEDAIHEAKNENTLGVGEDVSFCLRASAAGHQPYVDMGLRCGHLGMKVY
jgi:hypothetical protein